MNYEICGYGVELNGEVVDVNRTLAAAEKLAAIVDGAEVVPVYREIKQEVVNE